MPALSQPSFSRALSMKRTVFLVCPTCKFLCGRFDEEGISNDTRTADQPCEKCQRKEQLKRAALHAESERLLDRL